MTTSHGRTVLAVDYGTRRIGLAKSDPTGLIASALMTLEVKSRAQAVQKLSALIADIKPDAVVIGYPLHDSGEPSAKCREIDRFIEVLRPHYDGPIERVDESYSSIEAGAIIHAHGRRVGQDKRRVDRLAAVIILQRYLNEIDR